MQIGRSRFMAISELRSSATTGSSEESVLRCKNKRNPRRSLWGKTSLHTFVPGRDAISGVLPSKGGTAVARLLDEIPIAIRSNDHIAF